MKMASEEVADGGGRGRALAHPHAQLRRLEEVEEEELEEEKSLAVDIEEGTTVSDDKLLEEELLLLLLRLSRVEDVHRKSAIRKGKLCLRRRSAWSLE